MAKAVKRGKSWRCRVYDYTDETGKKHYRSFTADTKKGAELKAAEWMSSEKQYADDRTVGEAIEAYINSREHISSPATIRGYRNIQRYCKKNMERLMSTLICDLNEDIMQDAVNTLACDNAPKTVKNKFSLITSATRTADKYNISMPQRIKPEYFIPSHEDIKKLLEIAKGTSMEVPIMLGAFCMMRRSEICGLKREDIDESSGRIRVRRAVVFGEDKEYHEKTTKTVASDRNVFAPDAVFKALKSVELPLNMTPSAISSGFERIKKKLGLQCRFHDLRHYCASAWHAQGIPDAYIMEQGGWGSDGVLKAVYRHAMEMEMKQSAMKMNDFFSTQYGL